MCVAPRAGAWIETLVIGGLLWLPESHPVRVRGLKQALRVQLSMLFVAPRAGAWIETERELAVTKEQEVAPRAGAWIETMGVGTINDFFLLMASARLPRFKSCKRSSQKVSCSCLILLGGLS